MVVADLLPVRAVPVDPAGRPRCWWLFVATFLVECVGLFWIPAKEASVPNLVRKDQLESANQLSLVTTYGITPVAAALVFSLLALLTTALDDGSSFFGANQVDLALYINALTFLVSALIVLTDPADQRPPRRRGRRASRRAAAVVEGWEFVGHTRLVRGLVIGILGAFAAGGAVIGAGKTYAASLGGGDADVRRCCSARSSSASALGMGLGPAGGARLVPAAAVRAVDHLRRRLPGAGRADAAPGARLVFVIGVGFGAGTAYLSGITLLGREVADEVRGRTFAFVQSLVRVVLILALAAAPFAGRAAAASARWTPASSTSPSTATRILLLAGRAARDRRRHRVLPADGRPGRRAGAAPTWSARCAATRTVRRRLSRRRDAHRVRGRRGRRASPPRPPGWPSG